MNTMLLGAISRYGVFLAIAIGMATYSAVNSKYLLVIAGTSMAALAALGVVSWIKRLRFTLIAVVVVSSLILLLVYVRLAMAQN